MRRGVCECERVEWFISLNISYVVCISLMKILSRKTAKILYFIDPNLCVF